MRWSDGARLGSWTLALALGGCAGDGPDETTMAVTTALDDTWLGELRADPSRFTAWVASDREGFVLLQQHRLEEAATRDGVVGLRARRELSALYAQLAHLQDLAYDGVLAESSAREAPISPAVLVFAALNQHDKKDAARPADTLPAPLTIPFPAPLARAAEPVQQRLAAHHAARDARDVGNLWGLAATPLWAEALGSGERRLYDPFFYRTVQLALAVDAPAEGPQALVFSGCLTLQDAQAEAQTSITTPELGCALAALTRLGVAPPQDVDDPQAASDLVAALDAALDPWLRATLASGDPGAIELFGDLRLVERCRARWLLALARADLHADRPRRALTFARLAVDLSAPREVSPVNHPGLFGTMAEAQARSGYHREALDALAPLSLHRPDLVGLTELLGDWAILVGLDRHGESKEN
ncbi:MAG: hypothetical protein IPN01_10465 [Deltaproteobacteria bacterium]|nr:hypothetical protein [Deltaproteobacteria bacterium]